MRALGCPGSSSLCVGFLQLPRTWPPVQLQRAGSHCGGLSRCRGHRGLSPPSFWHVGLVVTDHRLECGLRSCGAEAQACGIFLEQGMNPGPLHWKVGSQPLGHQGSPKLSYSETIWPHALKIQTQVNLSPKGRHFQ